MTLKAVLFIIMGSYPLSHVASSYQDAFNAYQQHDYNQASTILTPLATTHPSSPLFYDLGVVAYKKGDYDTAISYFSAACEDIHDLSLQEKSYFNCGNAHVQKKQLREALHAYTQCLDLNPENKEAAHNKKIVEKMLEKQDAQDQKNQQDNQDKQDNQSQENNNNSQENDNNEQENNQDQQDKEQDQKEDTSREKNQKDEQHKPSQDPNTQNKNQDQNHDSHNSHGRDHEQKQEQERQNNNNALPPDNTIDNKEKSELSPHKEKEHNNHDKATPMPYGENHKDLQEKQDKQEYEQWVVDLLEQQEKADKNTHRRMMQAIAHPQQGDYYAPNNW